MEFSLKIVIRIKHYINKLKRKSVILQKDNNPIKYNDGIIYQYKRVMCLKGVL